MAEELIQNIMLNRYLKKDQGDKGFEIEDSIMTVTEKEEAIVERPYERKGLNFLYCLALAVIVILFGRVFQLAFLQGEYYRDLSKGNRIRSIIIKAPRGKILDRSGQVLVRNVPSIDVVIIPNKLPSDQEKRRFLSSELAKLLSLEKGNVEVAIESQDRESPEPVLLKENVSEEEALIVSERQREFEGIALENTAIRNYENSAIFSSIIGYDGKISREELEKNPSYRLTDYIGKAGIEKQYEKDLKGIDGARQVEVNAEEKIKKELGIKNSISGSDLILNVDEGLQKKIYDSIAFNLEQTNTKVASAVAIDPRTGGVLALVSFPSFDNNLFAGGISNEDYKKIITDKNLPLFNRAVSGEYPPGSTIKPAIASGALEERTISQDTSVNCSGGISLGVWHFGDWKTHGGGIDVRKAIAESCDVFFYSVGGGYGNILGLGMDRMKKYLNLFGFGNLTEIDLPGETNGLIPDEKWKEDKIKERWYIGDSYHSAIGQGFVSVTPLQLANYTAALANGGKLFVPQVVSRIEKSNGEKKSFQPRIVRSNFISAETMRIVREGMRQTVESGTAQSLKDLPVAVAGKTGTAEFGSEKGKSHSWFISFAPYENPEIAMVVLVEGGGEFSSKAVPITRDVYKWYFEERK